MRKVGPKVVASIGDEIVLRAACRAASKTHSFVAQTVGVICLQAVTPSQDLQIQANGVAVYEGIA